MAIVFILPSDLIMHCLCIPMQIACENTVAFDSRKARTVLGEFERHLNGPISLCGVPTLMRYHLSGRMRVYANV